MSSGFRVLFSEEGIPYIKGVVFPSFAFPHPLSSYTQLLYPFPKHHLLTWPPMLKTFSVLLARLVVPPLGTWNLSNASSLVPLLRTQYVFSLFILLTVSNILFFFFRMGCPFTWIPELLKGLYIPLITT
jgi:hypothetical protein